MVEASFGRGKFIDGCCVSDTMFHVKHSKPISSLYIQTGHKKQWTAHLPMRSPFALKGPGPCSFRTSYGVVLASPLIKKRKRPPC